MRFEELAKPFIEDRDPGSAAIAAQKLLAHVREVEPSALTEWLDDRAEPIVTDWIASKWNYRRAASRDRKAEKLREAMDLLHALYVVDENYTRRRLGEMRAEDLLFAASEHERDAKAALFEASFLRAIAKQLDGKRVRDVFTAEELHALRERLRK